MRVLPLVLSSSLLLVACGGDGGADGPAADATSEPAVAIEGGLAPEAVDAAKAVYRKAACFGCHGHEAKGAMAGPTLSGLAAHWTADDLSEFIADPAAGAADDERLTELAGRFAMPMARPMVPLTPAERLQLAEWLLTL
jgi:cytochrome c551/c552